MQRDLFAMAWLCVLWPSSEASMINGTVVVYEGSRDQVERDAGSRRSRLHDLTVPRSIVGQSQKG